MASGIALDEMVDKREHYLEGFEKQVSKLTEFLNHTQVEDVCQYDIHCLVKADSGTNGTLMNMMHR